MRRYLLSACLILCVLAGLPVPVTAQDNNAPARITPLQMEARLCEQQCLRQPVEVSLENLPSPSYQRVDVLFLFDVTGSMRGEVAEAQREGARIARDIQALVPSSRFALGQFADYNIPSAVPWELIQAFTPQADQIIAGINELTIVSGGDTPESSTRALYEASQLGWRADATRLVVLFTDAPPHETDQETGVTFSGVLQTLAANDIRILAIDSSGPGIQALRRASEETDGRYFALGETANLGTTVVNRIEEEVEEERQRNQLRWVAQAPGSSAWVTSDPQRLDYPQDGTLNASATLEFCPADYNLQRGDYNFDVQLQNERQQFGSVAMNVAYSPKCVDLFVPDNAADDGDACSDARAEVFWESPSIVVRQNPDGGATFQYPRPGTENYVYVSVQNIGLEPAESAEMVLYASPRVIVADYPADWREIARESFTLPPGETVRLGPFPWQPSGVPVSLRVEVTDVRDDVEERNDIACDSNIAQMNRLPLQLEHYSLVPAELAAFYPLLIRSPDSMGYESLDFIVQSGRVDRPHTARMLLTEPLFDSERSPDDRIGYQLQGIETTLQTTGQRDAVADYLPGFGAQATGFLLVSSPDSEIGGPVTIGLEARDRIVAAATVDLFPPEPILTDTQRPSGSPLLPVLIPIGLFFLLMIAAALGFSARLMRR